MSIALYWFYCFSTDQNIPQKDKFFAIDSHKNVVKRPECQCPENDRNGYVCMN